MNSLAVQRRAFLGQSACGLGTVALSQLLAESNALPGAERDRRAQLPHHRPHAKNVIFLFMAGAPSHLDLFEPKEELRRRHGQPVPTRLLGDLDDALIRGSARLFASPRRFRRHGECGMPFSDYLPKLAGCADDLCMVRSMVTTVSNHHPAQLLMNCGMPRFGLPSMGAWVTYGLGSESRDLPGFVVMLSRNGPGDLGGSALWDNAFLPAAHRGVTFRSQGEAILFLDRPSGITARQQARRLATIGRLNRLRYRQHPDPEILSRIGSYELAFRMQTAAPELLDVSRESARTLEAYGVHGKLTRTFGSNCLLARRLVERGVRFVQLYHYTWDDHSDLNRKLQNNCRITDGPAAALIQDLKQRGLLDETLVVWGGEFGRTPMNEVRRGVNPGREGRDHHPFGFTVLLAGGGIQPGRIYGATDELGYHAAVDPVSVHDLQATLLDRLGLDHTQLTYRHQGRDVRLTDVHGEVVRGIVT